MPSLREMLRRTWAAIKPRSWDEDVRAAKKLVAAAFNRDHPLRELCGVRFLADEPRGLVFRAAWTRFKTPEGTRMMMKPGDFVVYVVSRDHASILQLDYEQGKKQYCWHLK